MDKTFEAQSIEANLYQKWTQSGGFKASNQGNPYCIMLPPPNVTGSLHMGHGFQQTLMDALIRYHRMRGFNTHWQMGVDHAGIATQMVVERQLAQENKTRNDLGREAFVERVWEWKAQSGGTIESQMKRMGASADWDKSRFTMDEGLSKAVQEVFVKLFDEGLIYRGQRLVNWDPKFQTALSDLEVISTPAQGTLWHIRYPLADSDESVVIATTRPETLLGDTAIAVHPEDERYQHLIGKEVALPLCDRKIPIIADDYVEPEFGSGVVKITPAHDFNDYEVGKRHNLPMINIMTLDAKINENAPQAYQGMDRFDARKQILKDLTELNLLVKEEPNDMQLPMGDRSNVVVEPMLTPQWYVKADALAKPAIEAVRSGKIKFVPQNWENTYYQWLENIQDWCISRQLWWGHRIPAWYDDADNVYVGESEKHVREKYNLDSTVSLHQDEDVLDTWFSSALWPFSTLGWPEKTAELDTFYPTSVLVTGFDIIFFWVARMVMMGLKFMDNIPFHTVYVTGLIRDAEGHKMSKSKGNVLDPIDLIDGISLEDLLTKRTSGMMQPHLAEKIKKATQKEFPDGIEGYGTDPLRFTYCALASTGRDIRFDTKRLEGYRNFCNKLWNAARFVLMNKDVVDSLKGDVILSPHDKYIESKLQQLTQKVHTHFENYRFDLLAKILHEFTWGEFCDWYLEFAKTTFYNESASIEEKRGTLKTALTTLETILKLLHPIMPFITDTIWEEIKKPLGRQGETIMLEAYPEVDQAKINSDIDKYMDWCKEVIISCRTIRAEMNLSPAKPLNLYLNEGTEEEAQLLSQSKDYIEKLAKIENIHWNEAAPKLVATQYINQLKLSIDLEGLVDPTQERDRLNKQIAKLDKQIVALDKKLQNPGFINKAPQDVVEKEKQTLAELSEQHQKLKNQLSVFE